MKIETKYISKENSKKLLNEVLLSLKSKSDEPIVRRYENYTNESNNKEIHEIHTNSISVCTDDIRSFNLRIKKWDNFRWFKLIPNFIIDISIEGRSYGDNFELEIVDNQEIIKEIYQYLIDFEESRKREEANKKISSIIGDISTTVDRGYRRDETIDEILN